MSKVLLGAGQASKFSGANAAEDVISFSSVSQSLFFIEIN